MNRSIAHFLAVASLFLAGLASATPTAPGFNVTFLTAPGTATGDVVSVGGAVFVGVGSFGAGGQSVVRLDAGGGATVLADGFNSLGGFAYDAANDRLLVGDNGGDLPGTLTGDTVYAIGDPFGNPVSPASALGLEILAAGSIPGYADVVLDPSDPTGNTLLITDASASFPPLGAVIEVLVDSGTSSVVQPGLSFAAGLATDASLLFAGDALLDFSGQLSSVPLAALGDPLTPIASFPSGIFGVEVAPDGSLLVTTGGSLLRVDPSDGSSEVLATGFGFATGVYALDDGTIFALDGFAALGEENRVWQLVPIPEPGAAGLVAAGLIALGALRHHGSARRSQFASRSEKRTGTDTGPST